MTLLILFLGFLFASILQYAKLNKFNTISGLALLEDYTVAKALLVAVGFGMIILNVEIGMGAASYHVKPFLIGGVIIGGLIFGSGMAILGYCPGTMAISFGEGSLDAFFGILGGLVSGLVYTLVLPAVGVILGPNLGTISLNSITGGGVLFYILVVIIGGLFVYISFWLNRIEKGKNYKWLLTGLLLAILNAIVFSKGLTNRPIGASTSYPYLADYITRFTHNEYFDKINKPGSWEMIFLAGAMLAGLVNSLVKKEFKLRLIHENWKKYKGTSSINRIIWSFVGGFILIFGARMAGGCTSGHILSGGMQLAISSLIFAVFVSVGLIITGQLFYKKNRN